MGITGLGLVWRSAAMAYPLPVWPAEVILLSGLVLFLILILTQLLRVFFCHSCVVQEWRSRAGRNFFCAATISGFLLAMALLPYSFMAAKLLWIASLCAQLIFLVSTFRRWLIDELEAHEISPVWLIPMVGNASPAFTGGVLGFYALSKMMLFSAILCWTIFMPLIIWRIVFITPQTTKKAMPGLAIMISAPAVIAVALDCLYGTMTELAQFMAWTALFFGIVLVSLWRRMLPGAFGRGWWGFTFPSTALASALIRVDVAIKDPLNHMIAISALWLATGVVCAVAYLTCQHVIRPAVDIADTKSGPDRPSRS